MCASSRVVRALPCMGRVHVKYVFVSFLSVFFFFTLLVKSVLVFLNYPKYFSAFVIVKVTDANFHVKLEVIASRLEYGISDKQRPATGSYYKNAGCGQLQLHVCL